MANLYEINEAILDCVDVETGEIIDEEKLGELQLAFDEKVEGLALWVKNLLSEADAIKAEKNALAEREKVCRNKAESVKKYLSGVLDGVKFKTPKVAISYRKSEAVEVEDWKKIPEDYLKYKDPDVDKTELKKALKAGASFEGVALVEKQNIQIK